MEGGPLGETGGVSLLGAEEGQGQVDAFDLAQPLFFECALAPHEEVLLDVGKPGQHLGIDLEHGAADACILTNKDKIRQNRNKACPSSRPRPAGEQCDEYPFASTWQGASTGGQFSRRMINAKQNEEGGKALGRFYRYNRIQEQR
ncbi:NucA/NucB deoxyribonuclease domain-containing protein [Streptomyces sp. Ru62]|uniref:NucA/NucB deoxyribonuclease domain-containing protein n=1 Tax=Streptomyces sp. Ru62 TaxID=2080745 RepID=UPI0015E294C3|nr:NucA/NucB deoxyribonuclease domain-containing protein [Streptomyces sp. Ru62]